MLQSSGVGGGGVRGGGHWPPAWFQSVKISSNFILGIWAILHQNFGQFHIFWASLHQNFGQFNIHQTVSISVKTFFFLSFWRSPKFGQKNRSLFRLNSMSFFGQKFGALPPNPFEVLRPCYKESIFMHIISYGASNRQ